MSNLNNNNTNGSTTTATSSSILSSSLSTGMYDYPDYLLCQVCCSPFSNQQLVVNKQPAILACGHSYCYDCLEKYVTSTRKLNKEKQNDSFNQNYNNDGHNDSNTSRGRRKKQVVDNHVECPTCRRVILKKGEVRDLPRNYALMEAVAHFELTNAKKSTNSIFAAVIGKSKNTNDHRDTDLMKGNSTTTCKESDNNDNNSEKERVIDVDATQAANKIKSSTIQENKEKETKAKEKIGTSKETISSVKGSKDNEKDLTDKEGKEQKEDYPLLSTLSFSELTAAAVVITDKIADERVKVHCNLHL